MVFHVSLLSIYGDSAFQGLTIETRNDIDVNLNVIDVILLLHGLEICHNAPHGCQ
jgi:hypothetical protein